MRNPLMWIDPWGWVPCPAVTNRLQEHANEAKKAVYSHPQRTLTPRQRAAIRRVYERGDI